MLRGTRTTVFFLYPTTMWENLLTQIYLFLVLLTNFAFDLEKFISKNLKKYIFLPDICTLY